MPDIDISKARRLVELEKDGRKVLLTVWEGSQVSSCVEEQDEEGKYCETCHCDDDLCEEYIDHLKSQGYQATEFTLREPEPSESLPRFLQERQVRVEPRYSLGVSVNANIETDEALPGGPGELQSGEPGDSGPEPG